jgi:aromatic ring-opening dioxygenase catalytic subunit (LigB family)
MTRLPTVYLPHGGGPWPFVDLSMFDRREQDSLAGYLRGLSTLRPRAILCVSAHWEAAVPSVMAASHPPMLYDYYGFPPSSYEITWPAPGDPALATRVRDLLHRADFTAASDGERGFDHGTFVPLKLAYPQADVPTIQLSLIAGLDPQRHLALGRALAPLRDEGVLIVGSGMSYHNMHGFGGRGHDDSERFDAWLGETMASSPQQRTHRLAHWTDAPSARACHPREEHLLPLMVITGAAEDQPAVRTHNDLFGGVRVSAFHLG